MPAPDGLHVNGIEHIERQDSVTAGVQLQNFASTLGSTRRRPSFFPFA
jgi:hypothetical protein